MHCRSGSATVSAGFPQGKQPFPMNFPWEKSQYSCWYWTVMICREVIFVYPILWEMAHFNMVCEHPSLSCFISHTIPTFDISFTYLCDDQPFGHVTYHNSLSKTIHQAPSRVGRGNAGWTAPKNWCLCPCQNYWWRPPAEKTARGCPLNHPSCLPKDLTCWGTDLTWPDLIFTLLTCHWVIRLHHYLLEVTQLDRGHLACLHLPWPWLTFWKLTHPSFLDLPSGDQTYRTTCWK